MGYELINTQVVAPFLSFTVDKFNLPKSLFFIPGTHVLYTVDHAAKWSINYCEANMWRLYSSS